MATDSYESLGRARSLMGELIAAGASAGEFELDGSDQAVVLEFPLHGHVGPRFHHRNPRTAVDNVQRLFRRAVGVSP